MSRGSAPLGRTGHRANGFARAGPIPPSARPHVPTTRGPLSRTNPTDRMRQSTKAHLRVVPGS
jgi:hypothetical protein